MYEKPYLQKSWPDPISAINIKIAWMRTGPIIKNKATKALTLWRKQNYHFSSIEIKKFADKKISGTLLNLSFIFKAKTCNDITLNKDGKRKRYQKVAHLMSILQVLLKPNPKKDTETSLES